MKSFWKKNREGRIRGLFGKKASRDARMSTEIGVIRRHTEVIITEESIVPNASKSWEIASQNEPCNWDPLAHEKPDKTPPYQVEISGGPATTDDIPDSGSLTFVDSRSPATLTSSFFIPSYQRNPSCWSALSSIFRTRKVRGSGIALDHISNGAVAQDN